MHLVIVSTIYKAINPSAVIRSSLNSQAIYGFLLTLYPSNPSSPKLDCKKYKILEEEAWF